MLITHCAGIISTACAVPASWVCQLRILRYGFALQLRPALVIKLISDLWCYALPERRRMFRFPSKDIPLLPSLAFNEATPGTWAS